MAPRGVVAQLCSCDGAAARLRRSVRSNPRVRPDCRQQDTNGSLTCESSPVTGSVAVIGAGPGGLIAARWLLTQGFEPTVFERGQVLGGQWAGIAGQSGVWPTMHTNTSRVLTAFSDLE